LNTSNNERKEGKTERREVGCGNLINEEKEEEEKRIKKRKKRKEKQ